MSFPRLWRYMKMAIVIAATVFLVVTFLIPNPPGGHGGAGPHVRPVAQAQHQNENEVPVADVPFDSIDRKSVPNDLPIFRDGEKGNFEPEIVDIIGNGEGGKPHSVSGKQNEEQYQKSQYGMNIVVSNDISPNRTIPDFRLEECKHWDYPAVLPAASVIVVFHNEGLSVLMRTVHSVINRSPRQFLHEVVLVDDFSDKKNLKTELEQYVATQFPKGLVRLVRNKERQGLIRSRAYGAEVSTGEVIVFLDAHCEVGYNWLPPLLAPIKQNRKTMTVPVIDGIDMETFEYRPVYHGKQHFRGIFEWGMLYKEIEIPEEEIKRRSRHSEPYKSPTHAGGLFAMDREYFLTLGGYDPGLLVWGGENFELSFKIWQCGGQILWVPCSRVGHVYRGFMPYSFGDLGKKRKGPLITINYKRVVEVWMDDFKEYFYAREPMARDYDAGDITEQLKIKERLKCKPFSWFMKEVAYDVLKHFPYLPRNVHWGHIKPARSGRCLDSMRAHPPTTVATSGCHGGGGNQLFRLNAAGQLGVGERCVDANTEKMMLTYCKLGTVDGPWSYDEATKQLKHRSTTGITRCLTDDGVNIRLSPCKDQDIEQQFTFEEIHS